MARPVIVSPRALAEIGEAHDWYERQTPGLGRRFLDAIEARLGTIERDPLAFAIVRPRVRRALVSRFPYAVFFAVGEDEVRVLAVVHTSRSPRRWPAGDQERAADH